MLGTTYPLISSIAALTAGALAAGIALWTRYERLRWRLQHIRRW
jgi:hypothetical protein